MIVTSVSVVYIACKDDQIETSPTIDTSH